MSYVIELRRRDLTDMGYEAEPWCAAAFRKSDKKLIAVQFGSHEGIALARTLRFVREDQQRQIVTIKVS